jgi:hypothetical protein
MFELRGVGRFTLGLRADRSHSDHPDERRWSEFEARWMELARDEAELAALKRRIV